MFNWLFATKRRRDAMYSRFTNTVMNSVKDAHEFMTFAQDMLARQDVRDMRAIRGRECIVAAVARLEEIIPREQPPKTMIQNGAFYKLSVGQQGFVLQTGAAYYEDLTPMALARVPGCDHPRSDAILLWARKEITGKQ